MNDKMQFEQNGVIIVWNVQAQVNQAMEMMGEKIAELAGENNAMAAMLVFEELFVNIANYAYPNSDDKPATVECIKLENAPLKLVFYDNGLPFNPTTYDIGETSEEQIGGHGIRMVKEMTSMFEYERKNNQNIVTVILADNL